MSYQRPASEKPCSTSPPTRKRHVTCGAWSRRACIEVFFKASKESIRRCIVKRESEGQYDVRGGGGNRYFGAYQMSDALADGATHMMLKGTQADSR